MSARIREPLRVTEEEMMMAVEWGIGKPGTPNKTAAAMVLRLRKQLARDTIDRIKSRAETLPHLMREDWGWILEPPPPEAPHLVPDGPIHLGGFTATITRIASERPGSGNARPSYHWVRGQPWDGFRKKDALCGHINQMRAVTYPEKIRPPCALCRHAYLRARLSERAWSR